MKLVHQELVRVLHDNSPTIQLVGRNIPTVAKRKPKDAIRRLKKLASGLVTAGPISGDN
jgi:hypothetical protein